MDKEDENFYERSDWSTYNEPVDVDKCAYCGEELQKLNVVHYQYHPKESGHYRIVAVNPLPHEKIVVDEGCIRRTDLICDDCLKEEMPDA